SSPQGVENSWSLSLGRGDCLPLFLCLEESSMCCCTDGRATAQAPWLRRVAALVEWALPVTTLALMPKCPACVAAYSLLFTGVGLSLPAASALRWTLIGLSVTALLYLFLRATRRAANAFRET